MRTWFVKTQVTGISVRLTYQQSRIFLALHVHDEYTVYSYAKSRATSSKKQDQLFSDTMEIITVSMYGADREDVAAAMRGAARRCDTMRITDRGTHKACIGTCRLVGSEAEEVEEPAEEDECFEKTFRNLLVGPVVVRLMCLSKVLGRPLSITISIDKGNLCWHSLQYDILTKR